MYGDPDELDRLAQGLRERATVVRREAADHVRSAESARWVSAAAQAYRQTVAQNRADVDAAADSLDAAAQALSRHADVIRERTAAIARAEQAVRSWVSEGWAQTQDAASHVTTVVVDGVQAGVRRVTATDPSPGLPFAPGRLPAPGEAAWLDLYQAMAG